MLSSFESLVFIVYLSMLFVTLVAIQVLNPGQTVRDPFIIEDKGEPFVQSELEEPESDSDVYEQEIQEIEEEFTMTAQPEAERTASLYQDVTMTENPMLRHRNHLEMVD